MESNPNYEASAVLSTLKADLYNRGMKDLAQKADALARVALIAPEETAGKVMETLRKVWPSNLTETSVQRVLSTVEDLFKKGMGS